MATSLQGILAQPCFVTTVDPATASAMSLKLQKRLAASLLGCGKKRVWSIAQRSESAMHSAN